ncbi:Rid family hydrolase [Streptomyces sp. NBC_01693]|uniref:RidA family protein n=1 Tax=unclassified Streptomyces TaxID=2593676 RepID=UPI002B0029EA|nr:MULTISPECIES: Rid family hydrolase [unclassified Streptomyces]
MTGPTPGAGPTRRAVVTDRAPAPAGAYSQGMTAGPYLFTSGFGPQDPDTGAVADTVEEQTAQVLRNLGAVLEAEGLGPQDVVKVTAHLQHLRRDFAAYDAAYRAFFTAPHPVRTTVGSDLMDILVEIDVVALRREAPALP